jgi:hypothetical protein
LLFGSFSGGLTLSPSAITSLNGRGGPNLRFGRLKPLLILLGLCGAIEVAPFQSCFESSFRLVAPEGAIGNAALSVCLKAYPDTNLEFFRNR